MDLWTIINASSDLLMLFYENLTFCSILYGIFASAISKYLTSVKYAKFTKARLKYFEKVNENSTVTCSPENVKLSEIEASRLLNCLLFYYPIVFFPLFVNKYVQNDSSSIMNLSTYLLLSIFMFIVGLIFGEFVYFGPTPGLYFHQYRRNTISIANSSPDWQCQNSDVEKAKNKRIRFQEDLK